MRVRDEQFWSKQEAEANADGERGQAFLYYVRFVLDSAEKVLDEKGEDYPDGNGWNVSSIYEAFQQGLALAEENLGALHTEDLETLLVVTISHWAHAEDLFHGMTTLERRVFGNAFAAHQAALQAFSEDEVSSDESSD